MAALAKAIPSGRRSFTRRLSGSGADAHEYGDPADKRTRGKKKERRKRRGKRERKGKRRIEWKKKKEEEKENTLERVGGRWWKGDEREEEGWKKKGRSGKDRGPEAVGKELVTQCRQESGGAM